MTEMVERVRAVAWYLRVRALEDQLERVTAERDYLGAAIQQLSETGQYLEREGH